MDKEQREKMDEIRRKSYDKLSEHFKLISTWSDFFEMMEKKMKQWRECGCPGHTLDALATHHAFVLTMKELPEEGDIRKIVDHMARMMVYEGEEKLGSSYIDDEEAKRLAATSGLAAHILGGNLLAALASGGAHIIPVQPPGTASDAAEDNSGSGEVPASKKHLH